MINKKDFFNLIIEQLNTRVKISDKEILPPEERIMYFSKVLSTLTPKEEKILRMRFGIGTGGTKYTQQEIGRHLTITGSRVSQIQNQALRKLMHPARLKFLKGILNISDSQKLSEKQNAEISPVIETINRLTPELIAHLKKKSDDLNKLHWKVFEHLVAEFFASWGFDEVKLVGRSKETSADIFAAYLINPAGIKQKYFIEVKRWKDRIGIEVINQVIGAMISERDKVGWHAAMIVTVVGYKDFEKWTKEELVYKGLYLKDKDDLLIWLNNYEHHKNGLWLPKPINKLTLN
ncbi:MAG: sigma factor-like helix-turn-helix DNA-binding protein [Thermodesulfovibrionia bacterium]|nr:sigma factor-like helix-turn-helix DNA-binding protein [Thermodesulfovibrionia bacterium]